MDGRPQASSQSPCRAKPTLDEVSVIHAGSSSHHFQKVFRLMQRGREVFTFLAPANMRDGDAYGKVMDLLARNGWETTDHVTRVLSHSDDSA
ncbi:hypothetical protein HDU93_007985, partial [Gonapodya sp. JEL0774]